MSEDQIKQALEVIKQAIINSDVDDDAQLAWVAFLQLRHRLVDMKVLSK